VVRDAKVNPESQGRDGFVTECILHENKAQACIMHAPCKPKYDIVLRDAFRIVVAILAKKTLPPGQ